MRNVMNSTVGINTKKSDPSELASQSSDCSVLFNCEVPVFNREHSW